MELGSACANFSEVDSNRKLQSDKIAEWQLRKYQNKSKEKYGKILFFIDLFDILSIEVSFVFIFCTYIIKEKLLFVQ